MINEHLTYMAGIVDGEGTITLTPTSSSKFRTPCLSVSNSELALLEPFLVFGGRIMRKKKNCGHPNWKVIYEYRIRGDKALEAVGHLYPYLRHPEKIRRASMLLTTYKNTTKRNGKYNHIEYENKKNFEREFLTATQGDVRITK